MVKGGINCFSCDYDYTEGYWLEIEGEEPIFYCRECAEKANLIGAPSVYEHGPNTVVEVVVLETTEPVERFQLVVPIGDPKAAVRIATDEVEARGYNVIPNGCSKCIENRIMITVTPSASVYEHKEEEEGEKMKQKLKEIFDLDWIRNFAEKNIDFTEWIEEDYDGEKRKILLIETLVTSQHGAYIPGMVLELFGQAEGYDLEDPYNYEKNATIHDTLMYWEDKINDCLNELLPSKGRYYVGYHEYDGSYCLFYEEYEEEAEQV